MRRGTRRGGATRTGAPDAALRSRGRVNRRASTARGQGAVLARLVPFGWAAAAPAGAPAADSASSSRPPSLIEAARSQVGVTVLYDPSYIAIAYPGGDLPRERGVCADLVIRAFREARGLGLQRLVHLDRRENFSACPKLWGLSRPDPNIDHRRVPDLQTWFHRREWSVPATTNAADYLPGDLVPSVLPGNLPHIVILSDRRTEAGVPLEVRDIGAGARKEDRHSGQLRTGHCRPPAPRPSSPPASVPSPRPAAP